MYQCFFPKLGGPDSVLAVSVDGLVCVGGKCGEISILHSLLTVLYSVN